MLVLMGFAFSMEAQQTPIPEWPESKAEFLKELNSFLKTSNRNDIKALAKANTATFGSGALTDEQFLTFRTIANDMLKKKLRPYPYFYFLSKSLNGIHGSGMAETQMDSWLNVTKSIVTNLKRGKNKPLDSYLQFTYGLYAHKALKYSKTSVNWNVSSKELSLKLKDEKPILEVGPGQLIAARKKDTITIGSTSGTYEPWKLKWHGKSGKVSFTRVGYGAEVFCEYGAYTVNTKSTEYSVDSAWLHHPSYFDEKQNGKFEDKLLVGNKASAKTYPRFSSKNRYLNIADIGNGMSYKGKFELNGVQLVGSGTKERKASVTFKNQKGKETLRADSENFLFVKDQKLTAKNAAVSIYFGIDSIFHPSIVLRYVVKDNLLELSKGGKGASQSQYFDSYHNVSIDADKLSWDTTTDSLMIGKVRMGISKPNETVVFESFDFFREELYSSFQSIADINPITIIKVLTESEGQYNINAHHLAEKINPNFRVQNIRALLMEMERKGLLQYDSDKERVHVQDKLIHYVEAYKGAKDYDNLIITSKNKKTNAILNMATGDMTINGAKSVIVSDSNLTVFKPFGDQVILKEDRDIDFDGKFYSGFGMFYGSNFHFDYDPFEMNLDSVQYFDLQIPTGNFDKNGYPELAPLKTSISDFSGKLVINAPGNKSAREDYGNFPTLTSTNKAKVYFSKKGIQGGAYKEKDFYFLCDPFEIDSMMRFDPTGIKFTGKLISAGILPELTETLRLQEDNSLGFTTKAPPGGWDLYEGKGVFNNEITLTHKGLIGSGKIQHQNANIVSDKILLLPNRMKAEVDSLNMAETRSDGYNSPEVRGKNVNVDWKPKSDSMHLSSKSEDFELFGGDKKLKGNLIITESSLVGSGLLDWKEARMKSKSFLFKAGSVESDSSDLKIKTLFGSSIAFNSGNLKSSVDFDNNKGSFKANQRDQWTDMPFNQYITTMNDFDWDMKSGIITFKAKQNASDYFVSTHPAQDSLRFEGSHAFYNLQTNALQVEGVPSIRVADALIYPDSGRVKIDSAASMQTLTNARILASTENQYHNIREAKVRIKGRKDYRASGLYQYNIGNIEQEIDLKDIRAYREGKKKKNYTYHTQAEGAVTLEDNFLIDPKTKFRGSVFLNAKSKNLIFKGYAQMISPKLPNARWFSIKSNIDRKNVLIAYNKPTSPQGNRLFTGIYIDKNGGKIYSTVMAPKKSAVDRPFFEAKGVMQYASGPNEFVLGDSLKLGNVSPKGNVLRFKNASGEIVCSGNYLLDDFIKPIKVKASGETVMAHEAKQIKNRSLVALDMHLPEKILKYITKNFEDYASDGEDFDYNKRFIKQALREFIPVEKQYKKTIEVMENEESFSQPKTFKSDFALFDVQWKWDPELMSYVSFNKVGVGSIGTKTIDKLARAFIEVRAPVGAGDEFNLHLASPSGDYFYFNYRKGQMKTVSSNEGYNALIAGLKKKEFYNFDTSPETRVDKSVLNIFTTSAVKTN